MLVNVHWDRALKRAVQWIDAEGEAFAYEPWGEEETTVRDASDDVVYPYESFMLLKRRDCYCYEGNGQKDAALIISASEAARGVTVLPASSKALKTH